MMYPYGEEDIDCWENNPSRGYMGLDMIVDRILDMDDRSPTTPLDIMKVVRLSQHTLPRWLTVKFYDLHTRDAQTQVEKWSLREI